MSQETSRASSLRPMILAQVFIRLETRDLIACSHVCRGWRTVAVGAPKLWTTLVDPPLSAPAFNTLVNRAKTSPITLDVCPKTVADYTQLCSLLKQVLHKLQSLDIYLYSSAARKFELANLWDALGRSAPNLKRFCLKSDFRLPSGRISVAQRASLFAGNRGQLKTLVIGGVLLEGTVPAFSDVRDLDIEAHCFDRYTSLATQFPEVRALAIHNISAACTHTYPPDNAPKKLPGKLNDLVLHFATLQPARDVAAWLDGCDLQRIRHLQAINADAVALCAVPLNFKPNNISCVSSGGLVELVLGDGTYTRTATVRRRELPDILRWVKLEDVHFARIDIRCWPLLSTYLRGIRRLENLEVLFPPRPRADEFGERAIGSMSRLNTVRLLVLLNAEGDGPAVFLQEANVLQFVQRVTPNIWKLGIPAGLQVSGYETLKQRGLDIVRT